MNNANLQQTTEKTIFQKFYEGWNWFSSLDVQPDRVVFKVPHHSMVEDSYLKAQKRINELCLPLVAERTGQLSNTFLIREA